MTINMDFDLVTYLTEKRDIVNHYLRLILDQFNPERELIQAMNHSLMAGGKRLRPILAIGSAEACGKKILAALPASCAIEMIHTYSLIHDDLPAMDDDDYRRGVPTSHKQFSEATAVLAGDALLTHAFTIMARPEAVFNHFPDLATRMKLILKISQASGLSGMVEGQMLDMQSFQKKETDDLTHLKKIHALKTGKMIISSVEAGAVSVGADNDSIEKLKIYANHIGLAFQVIDDILNIEGDPEIMGKAAGSDIVNDKMTFPAIMGLAESKRYARELVGNAIDAIEGFGEKAAPLRAIGTYIIDRDH